MTDRDPEPLPYDQARARGVVGSYDNDVMTLTIGMDGTVLRLEVRMKPEIRSAANTELPSILRPLPASICLDAVRGDASAEGTTWIFDFYCAHIPSSARTVTRRGPVGTVA